MAELNSTAADDLQDRTTRSLLIGLRIAVAAIAAAIMATSSLWRKLGEHHPLWPQLTAYGVLSTVLLAEVVLLARQQRRWSRSHRIAALGAVLCASSLSAWTLPDQYVTTADDWAFGTAGWFGVILLLDRPLTYLVVFLVLQELITVGRVAVAGPYDRDFLLNLVAGSIGVLGFPLGAALATTALQGVARAAASARREAERIRTAGELSARLHDQRQERFAVVFGTAEPVLQGLANRSLDPSDPAVQRVCAIEAARMRRLFAESDDVADPLLHELRHCADVADRRGVVVEFETTGSWLPIPLEARRALTEAPLAVLATAGSWARVSVIGTAGLLSVNVVADSGPCEIASADGSEVIVQALVDGDILWVEAQWQPSRSA